MLRAPTRSVLALVATLTACSSSSTTNSAPVDGGASGEAGATVLSFTPSNIDLGGWDLSQIGDVDLKGTSCVLDSETPDGYTALLCDTDFVNHVAHKVVTLPDQTKLSVWVMKSLRVEPMTVLEINRGNIPVVLVATGAMDLLGSVDVGPGSTGGAVNSGNLSFAPGVGPGGGTAGDSSGLAGGGASFCGLGGKGATFSPGGAPPVAPSPAYGTPDLVPLVAGSAGGNGVGTNDSASGGGALQLVAGLSFTLHSGAFLNAGGGGGSSGGIAQAQPAGAGGSGGALLIESPTVTIEGNVGANGGGGGQTGGASSTGGEPGHPDTVARGGYGEATNPPGADGSFATSVDGSDAVSPDTTSGAVGGGGGAGRIRINTTSGAAAITGAVSPAATTPCVSQGKLK
jgi:hypothetical protein